MYTIIYPGKAHLSESDVIGMACDAYFSGQIEREAGSVYDAIDLLQDAGLYTFLKADGSELESLCAGMD